jgi:N6-L-threonylcarbamoyladenine synthase
MANYVPTSLHNNLNIETHGGVIPELASRAHVERIIPVVEAALSKANIDKKDLTAVAYTQGPGLLGSLLVGNAFAKSLSLALNIPLNCCSSHAGTPCWCILLMMHFLRHPFPFLGLTVSGGHTQLVRVENASSFDYIG